MVPEHFSSGSVGKTDAEPDADEVAAWQPQDPTWQDQTVVWQLQDPMRQDQTQHGS